MKVIATSLAAIVLATAANAATVSYDASTSNLAPDWATTLMLPKFDPALGTLTKVTLKLVGKVDGSVKAENTSASSPASATLKLGAEIMASVAGAALSVKVEPFDGAIVPLSVFDGTLDFGGTSGTSFTSSAEEDGEVFTFANLGTFIGPGLVDIDVSADGTSSATGGSNMVFQFDSLAMGTTTITYTYDAPAPTPIPLPATLPLLVGSLFGVALLRRRKAN
jgi:hypothetical protein